MVTRSVAGALRCVDFGDVAASALIGGVGLGIFAAATGKITLRQYMTGLGIGAYLKNFYTPIRIGDECECQDSGLGGALNTLTQ